jgi:hypothetical protein
MADLTDVQSAIASLIAQTVYPNGTSQPSLTGQQVRIYPGWPQPNALDTDLAAGVVNISIFPKQEERNTTRYPVDQQVTVPAAPTLTATIVGQKVTIGGTVSTPQNVALNVNGTPYVYAVQPTDTLTGIATALANIAGGTSSGPVITVSGIIKSARVGAAATVAAEFKRQEKVFQISVWANAPAVRDALASPIDVALASIEFLTMPDGYAARIRYRSSFQDDALQKENLYRRDLNYTVEWATTQQSSAVQVTTITENLSADLANNSAASTTTFNF